MAKGFTGDNTLFVKRIKQLIVTDQIDNAIDACDKQKGSAGNVIKNGLEAYKYVQSDDSIGDQKPAIIQKELDETTQLEVPHLNRNLIIISTLASISTLVGLLGTVTGMIQAFAALARVGSPDAVGLANGISQALVTTALGISTAAVAIVFYNYFTNRIDQIIYAIDEASMALLHHMKTK